MYPASQQQQRPQSNPTRLERGILKQWDKARRFGIIYAAEGKRYFLHISKIIAGTPELYRRVTFTVGAARRPEELQQALNVRIGERVEVSK